MPMRKYAGWSPPVPAQIEDDAIVGSGLHAVVSADIVLAITEGRLKRALKSRPARTAARIFSRTGLIIPAPGSPLSQHITNEEAERRQS